MRKALLTASKVTAGSLLLAASMAGGIGPALAQTSNERSPSTAIGATGGALLEVSGEVPKALHLSQQDLLKLPRTEIPTKGKDGKESVYAGISLTEIMLAAGMKFDPGAMPVKGAVASYVSVEAADGYKAVYALAELDPTQSDRVLLLADRKDGEPLTATEGPLRIIAPSEKRQARWVRQVVSISLHGG